MVKKTIYGNATSIHKKIKKIKKNLNVKGVRQPPRLH